MIFDQPTGYFRGSENDQVMKKLADDANVIGVSAMKGNPLAIVL